MAKSSSPKNALKALANSSENEAPRLPPPRTSAEGDVCGDEVVAPAHVPDLAADMAKTIAGATFDPAHVALSTPSAPSEFVAAAEAAFKATEVPTQVTFRPILGRFRVVGQEHAGDRNGTRWIADLELEGNTAVEVRIELLGYGTGTPIAPPLVSFTLGAGNGNFYVARPSITEDQGVLTLRTVALKMAAKVKLRLAIDTYHSANR